ncbi:ran1-like protein kinase [Trichosporon asahii var. asahii CBS 8904]|uniref:Ran1-like protein kinase n=1 Tax=Trichosporon asahii var. asahii (strain CBS 8904) TaxID=1220162 RepID=K1VZI6_TRIAC|nr:ran1-like protein kinase [Trichosporon asahii var. asahii CBS 8904]
MDRLIEEPDCVYVVMDYGEEGDLFAMITKKQRILDGVDWLHQLGIAHRDVKPENIVCSKDGTPVRIVDLGLATSESTSFEFGCGSTFYIAPECLGEWSASATSYPTRTGSTWSVADPLFLRRILPISHQCLSILTQIFTLDPEHCITLDRLRELILNIDFFTDDAHVPASRREAAHHNVPVHVSAQYTDEVYDSPSLNAEPFRADSGSPPPQRSSSGFSDGPSPSTPRRGSSGTTPRVPWDSSLSTPVFEVLSQRKGQPLSPVPFAAPAVFL